MGIFFVIQDWYVKHQLAAVCPYITGNEKILDFGCGDLTLAAAMLKKFPKTGITGIDVVDSGKREKGIDFLLYDGKKIPFKNKTFDIATCYHVLHHTDDPESALKEICRVSQKYILLIEPVKRYSAEQWGVSFMDKLLNCWREEIDLPFHFLSKTQWYKIFLKLKLTVVEEKSAGVFPDFLPIGKTILFVLKPI